ncbi:hypothetical protein [Sphingomonas corticis]|uniref:Uncharacterized protein n=1 Tax=Sphingomonas corticis TaxID=2722791 RepID=A0ABX1CR62_9SPHN|nr:hypothetical protein [Sphingomonas corticis]NJR80429.1 hypothetical protein [Sphingomonas corticis]
MSQPITTETSGAAWKRPPDLSTGTIRQLAAIDRDQRRPLPPRRHEPICFKPLVEEDAQLSFDALDYVVAVLVVWIVLSLIIAFARGVAA